MEKIKLTPEQQLSIMIFTTLSAIGFDREFILHKSEVLKNIFNNLFRHFKYSNISWNLELVGSAAEGVSISCSDTDCMSISKDTVCFDTAYACKGFTVLEADYTNTAPGYVKLVLSHGEEESVISAYLQLSQMYKAQSGSMYISSQIFRNFMLQIMQLTNRSSGFEVTLHGPATTIVFHDHVLAMYYYGCYYLTKWSKRIRYCHWPSVSLIKEISRMEGYVVPVGHKSSDSQNIEWRVCYTTAELTLIRSMTDVQLKFYVFLKCVAKEIKKNVCEDITSYIVKNVVFWIVETEPEQAFTPTHLVKLLKKAIMFIKYCLQNNHLPNYMIPERNLIRENMNGKEKHKIIKELKEYEDFAILLCKVPKLCECICFVYQRPHIDIYKEWRKNIEKCFFAIHLCKSEILKPEMIPKRTLLLDLDWEFFKDIRFWLIMIRIWNLTVPDWLDLAKRGRMEYMLQLLFSRLTAMPSL